MSSRRNFVFWLNDLAQCVTGIHKTKHTELVDVVFTYDWNAKDENELSAYINFLVHLNSAHGHTFIKKTFENVVSKFKPPSETEDKKKTEPKKDTSDPKDPSSRFTYLHLLIRKLVSNIPDACGQLSSVIINHFPHKSFPLPIHEAFITNLLKIIDYCPFLREKLIHVIIDRIIQIDVEIKPKEIPDEEENVVEKEKENEDIGVFELEKEEDKIKEELKMQHTENAGKLDQIINILILYIQSCPDKDEIFKILMTVFEQTILTTHQSKYTQFIIFYICQMKYNYVQNFVFKVLLEKVVNPSCPLTIRQAATAYLASFIGRAKFVQTHVVRDVLITLSKEINQYIDTHSDQHPDCEKHGLFYLMVQSLFYIILFKHTTLEEMPASKQFFEDLELSRIVGCSLNPLKLIMPDIVKEFAWICSKLDVLDCRPIIQHNKHVILPTKSTFGGPNSLESFFPFDPCLLKLTRSHISEHYITWDALLETSPYNDSNDNDDNEPHYREPAPYASSYEDSAASMSIGGSFDVMNYVVQDYGSSFGDNVWT
uniref:RNA polymerase I-specific transcription initiation factor RRN3 n=1 Tax=Arcella intermedia TaxID=1963864 RepID=A0A6B2L176_9EUKA